MTQQCSCSMGDAPSLQVHYQKTKTVDGQEYILQNGQWVPLNLWPYRIAMASVVAGLWFLLYKAVAKK